MCVHFSIQGVKQIVKWCSTPFLEIIQFTKHPVYVRSIHQRIQMNSFEAGTMSDLFKSIVIYNLFLTGRSYNRGFQHALG